MNRADRLALIARAADRVTVLSRCSLRVFVELMWPILEPTTPFVPNWHIDLICEYLEAVTDGQITRLVINVPPRSMKSLLVSVLWPCWEWIRCPSHRYLFVSYTEKLAERHAVDRRRVLESEAYQHRYSVRLTRDQRQKLECHNVQRGMMVATSIGGSVTGKGGNRIIVDDPHNPYHVESDLQRQQAIDFFTQTLSTRLDNTRTDAIVIVMQRLHTEDLSGVCVDQFKYEHLCLPALEPRPRTITFLRSRRVVHRDTDEPLWPARENRAQLEAQRIVLGSFGFAGQYLQDPIPRTGGLFPPDWWQYVDHLPVAFDEILQSWDLTFKDGDRSDYVVGLVAGRVGAVVYLLDRYKEKVNFVDTCHAIEAFQARYPQTRVVLVEEAANGPAVVSTLHQRVPGLLAVKPEGGKESRAQAIQPMIEAKQVCLPNPRHPDGTLIRERAWVDDFVATCAAFPKGAHDDDVDALSQLLVRCQRAGITQRFEPWMLGPPTNFLKDLEWGGTSLADTLRKAFG